MNSLFGTDGIRGEVGVYPLTKEAVYALGKTLGRWLRQKYQHQRGSLKILVGKDTRESGNELELALANGLRLSGVEVLRVGVCPTPCVAFLTRTLGAHLGVAISASHNPGSDNGIKFFNVDGFKLFPDVEAEIEKLFFNIFSDKVAADLELKGLNSEVDCLPLYTDFVKSSLKGFNLLSLKIVIDCAFGAFSKIAPKVLRELGADIVAINDQPDGKNINVNCGTLYPQVMAEVILKSGADIGIAFDGDGDRVIIADEKGNILDGDYILAILARYLAEQNRLPYNLIVCTQMSNIGLELYLRGYGVGVVRTRVGDKYVLQEMLKCKANLGGEQSGHIIILERTTTGDGLVVALELIKVILEKNSSLSELSKGLHKFPQVLVNVRVKEKIPFAEIPGLNDTITRWQSELGNNGRVLVRYSGTEKLARIMIEGREPSLVNRIANSVAGIIQNAIGEDR